MTDREIIDEVFDRCLNNVKVVYYPSYLHISRVLVRYTRQIEKTKWDDVWLLRLLAKFDTKTIEEIKEGLKAIKEDRVTPWSKIKEELNL